MWQCLIVTTIQENQIKNYQSGVHWSCQVTMIKLMKCALVIHIGAPLMCDFLIAMEAISEVYS